MKPIALILTLCCTTLPHAALANSLQAYRDIFTVSFATLAPEADSVSELAEEFAYYGSTDLIVSRFAGLALLIAELRETREPADMLIADVLTARLLMSVDGAEAARDILRAGLARARTAGFGDRQLGSALADLAVTETRLRNDTGAEHAFARARLCAPDICAGDLLQARLLDGPEAADITLPGRGTRDAAVRTFIDTYAPGRPDIWRLYLRQSAAGLSDDFPILSAEYYETVTSLSIRAITADDDSEEAQGLLRLVHGAMVQNLAANRFSAVARIAAAYLDKFGESAMAPRARLDFRRVQLRARLRSGDVAASGDYGLLVELALNALDADHGEGSPVPAAAERVLEDVMDTPNLEAAHRLARALQPILNSYEIWTRIARIRHRMGAPDEAADILRQLREITATRPEETTATLAYTAQEAAYRQSAGEDAIADALLSTLPVLADAVPERGTPFATPSGFLGVEEQRVREIMELRDAGNYEGAAWLLQRELGYIPTFAARGEYRDSQWLWQMAYTFARGGKQVLAFDTMRRAAAIAAKLSFADPSGPDGGTLQLLQRDRWRYLLFIDIAWGATQGIDPEDMLVVSDY